MMAEKLFLESEPYAWPFDGSFRSTNTAILAIDMQVDFCASGGYVDTMGYDGIYLAHAKAHQAAPESIRSNTQSRFHSNSQREGHRPDLADCPLSKRWRSQQIGAGIGDSGPCGRREIRNPSSTVKGFLVRGEPGWKIISELAPADGELVIDEPGKGAFVGTDLDMVLRTRGMQNLVLTGVTTDVCVHTTVRNANDMGYECVLLEVCCATTDPLNHSAAISMIKKQGGVFGAVSTSAALIKAMENK